MPINYQDAVIYKLCCNDPNIKEVYIGSTVNPSRRKHTHKSHSISGALPVYQFIRANGGWSNWSMVQIESFSCNSKTELEARERHHIDQCTNTNAPILNICTPNSTPQETMRRFLAKNPHKAAEYRKTYYDKNQAACIEKAKAYYAQQKARRAELEEIRDMAKCM